MSKLGYPHAVAFTLCCFLTSYSFGIKPPLWKGLELNTRDFHPIRSRPCWAYIARKRRSGALTNQGFIPPLGESKSSSYRSTVSRELNPYEPPPAKPLESLLWDRSVLTQLGFGIHVLVLIVYILITIASDRSASSILAEIDTRFHIAMATCTSVGFAMVFMITITTTDWPLHQRWSLIAIDLLFIGLITFVAHGFGLLGW